MRAPLRFALFSRVIRAGRFETCPCVFIVFMMFRNGRPHGTDDHTGSPLRHHIEYHDVSCRWMLTVSTTVYRLVCGLVPGDHTVSPLQHHIEYHDVSCRRMLTVPYNELSIDIWIRTGRPRGVAPTVSYRKLRCIVLADANRPLQWFVVWYADSYRVTTRGRPYGIISNIMMFRGGRMSSAPYNDLSIDMWIRTGRPRGVAPTVTYRKLRCIVSVNANRLYNGLLIGMRTRTGRPCGVASTASYRTS